VTVRAHRRDAVVAVDLGTAGLRVSNRTGLLVDEPTVIAYDHAGAVAAMGEDALRMVGRVPTGLRVVRPVRAAAIADLAATEDLLTGALRKAVPRRRLRPARVASSVPVSANQIERRARIRTLQRAGAGSHIVLVEAPLAAAIGAGLPVDDPVGSMVIDIGRGVTEAAVISLGAMVTAEADAVGGDTAEQAVIRRFREARGLAIGAAAAWSAVADLADGCDAVIVEGADLTTGMPRAAELPAEDLRAAVEETLSAIAEVARRALDRAPVALAGDVMVTGITVMGGGAHLPGAVDRIAATTGMPVRVADHPAHAVIAGLRSYLEPGDQRGQYAGASAAGRPATASRRAGRIG
jgi:rod shape-determining protein MreB